MQIFVFCYMPAIATALLFISGWKWWKLIKFENCIFSLAGNSQSQQLNFSCQKTDDSYKQALGQRKPSSVKAGHLV